MNKELDQLFELTLTFNQAGTAGTDYLFYNASGAGKSILFSSVLASMRLVKVEVVYFEFNRATGTPLGLQPSFIWQTRGTLNPTVTSSGGLYNNTATLHFTFQHNRPVLELPRDSGPGYFDEIEFDDLAFWVPFATAAGAGLNTVRLGVRCTFIDDVA